MPDALSDAKSALAHANAAFPSNPPAAAKPVPTSTKSSPSIGDELVVKKAMVDKARSALPKMHKGGPVPADGDYNLKAGEHVLTAKEAGTARAHALMASGMKSLAKPAPKVGKPTASMTITPMPKTTASDNVLASPVKPGMPTGSISPSPKAGPGWKAQNAPAHPGDTTRPTSADITKT